MPFHRAIPESKPPSKASSGFGALVELARLDDLPGGLGELRGLPMQAGGVQQGGHLPPALDVRGAALERLEGGGEPLRGGGRAATATAETHVAVVFAPPSRVDPNSPWGIFYTPNAWFDPTNANGPRDAAVQHRLLGAGWSRLNFWAGSAGDVKVTAGPDGI